MADDPTSFPAGPAVDTPVPATVPLKPALRGALHLVAFPISIVLGLVLVLGVADNTRDRIGCAIFAFASALLFGGSALYHRGHWEPRRRALLRRLDHSNIFVMIAGTYTPICLALLDGSTRRTALTVVWVGAVAGIVFRVVWLSAPPWVYTPFYVGLGWVAVAALPEFARSGGAVVVWLIAVGGIAYSLGALVYALRRPNPWPATFGSHEIFHSATLIGYGCHYAAVVLAIT